MTPAMREDLRETLAQLDWDRYRQVIAVMMPQMRGDDEAALGRLVADASMEYSCATDEQKQASRWQADKILEAMQDVGLLEKT